MSCNFNRVSTVYHERERGRINTEQHTVVDSGPLRKKKKKKREKKEASNNRLLDWSKAAAALTINPPLSLSLFSYRA